MVIDRSAGHRLHRPAWALAPPATLFLVPAARTRHRHRRGAASPASPSATSAILVADGFNTDRALDPRAVPRLGRRVTAPPTPVVWRAAGLSALPALIGDRRARHRAADLRPARLRLRRRRRRERAAAARPTRPWTCAATSTSRATTGGDRATSPTARAGSTCGWPRCPASARPAGATSRCGSTDGNQLGQMPGAERRAACAPDHDDPDPRLRLGVPAPAVRAAQLHRGRRLGVRPELADGAVDDPSRPGSTRPRALVHRWPAPTSPRLARNWRAPASATRPTPTSPAAPRRLPELDQTAGHADHRRTPNTPRPRPRPSRRTCAAAGSPTAPSRSPAAATRHSRTSC